MSFREYLFKNGYLEDYLNSKIQKLRKEIEEYGKDLLSANILELVESLANRYNLELPSLKEDKVTTQSDDENIDVSRDVRRDVFDRSEPFYIKGTSIAFFVPFSGEEEIFRLRPRTSTSPLPCARVSDNELVITFNVLDEGDKEVKKLFEKEIAEIKKWLGWASKDIEQYNNSLRDEINKRLLERREKLLKDQERITKLGFPLRKRDDTPLTYIAGVRKKIFPSTLTVGTKPTMLEPELSLNNYEQILDTISHMSLVIERNKKTFQKLEEEDIRNLFLVVLNAMYEGRATGETFNCEGKTDILIRDDNGKNIFIAECKFWRGKESLKEAIDQILKYTTWRDTKTAILIFNKNKDTSNVLGQILPTIREYPNFKKELSYPSETGFRCILYHRSDKERDLYLTILVFDIPVAN